MIVCVTCDGYKAPLSIGMRMTQTIINEIISELHTNISNTPKGK